jgi:hypothetical protein
MAGVRLSLALAAMAGCGRADAQPAAPAPAAIAVPAGWRALPEIAEAVAAAAAAPGVTISGSRAWGEPAMGCYAAAFELRGGDDTADAIATDVIAGFGGTLALTGTQRTAGRIDAAFARGAYRGELRVTIVAAGGAPTVSVLACFANDREPDACAATCAKLMGAT